MRNGILLPKLFLVKMSLKTLKSLTLNQKNPNGNIMPRMEKLEKELLFPEKEHWIFLTVARK